MRSKTFILGVLIIVVLLPVVVVSMFLFLGDRNTAKNEQKNPFASTSEERIVPSGEGDPFATIPDGWQRGSENKAQTAPLLRLLSKEPALGAMPFITDNEPQVRYVRRDTGNIYETPLEKVLEPRVVSSKQIARIGNVLWSLSANETLLQYTDDMQQQVFSFLGTFTTPAVASGTPTTNTLALGGHPLPNGVIASAFSPDGAFIFYLVANAQGASAYVESVTANTRTEVWSTPFRSVTALWPTQSTILVYNNPSLTAPGAVWSLNTKTWHAEAILGSEKALSASMSPDGAHLLYSLIDPASSVYSLRVIDTKSKVMQYLPLPTITEKCTWGRAETHYVYCAVPRNMTTKDYLEEWQYGTLLSDDVLWRFDTVSGTAKKVLDPSEEVTATFDMVDLAVDPLDTFLTFRTRNRDMLWAVRLPKETSTTPTATSTNVTTP